MSSVIAHTKTEIRRAASITATSASPTAIKERSISAVKEKYPNYKIIVLNDDFNTFEHVVRTLTTYIPGMDSDQAWELADQIHNEGQAIVWTGPLEQAELYHSQLIRAGLTMAPLEKA
ncbi:ATP-dependent Clp protease adapter ClpS [cf. Phormidesmis sp. LEGE 11477]|uniref:ATP-dependent Clp protease adapter ClpS n=1 Tax=cf. Phormidesmis sp. LEGE 11477 TaxID=1828680 RepID=UPI00187DEBDF|nr:ATP-dependent Clp protease adapter ClpS [cf. Phormidesmis sp. LEGE 11477]MBE9064784.1 ATP-dependent Clp protease adapter ClpS [cf. Phormidesmis sp. LEGE 11477]